MGATQERATIVGRTLQEAFKKLQDSDREEKGDDIYSGGWNNSCGIREVDAKEWNKYGEEEFIAKDEPAIAFCIKKPVGNKNKIKTTVTNFPVKGTRKWETRYQAESDACGWNKVIVSEVKQAEAIKKVRAYVENHPDESISLHIVKVLVGVKSRVAEIEYKPASNEADGIWEIFGSMSC